MTGPAPKIAPSSKAISKEMTDFHSLVTKYGRTIGTVSQHSKEMEQVKNAFKGIRKQLDDLNGRNLECIINDMTEHGSEEHFGIGLVTEQLNDIFLQSQLEKEKEYLRHLEGYKELEDFQTFLKDPQVPPETGFVIGQHSIYEPNVLYFYYRDKDNNSVHETLSLYLDGKWHREGDNSEFSDLATYIKERGG